MRNLGHALLVGIALAAPILQAMAQSDTAVGDEIASAPAGTVETFDFGDAILDDAHTPVCLGSSA